MQTERLNQGDGMKRTLIALAVGSAFAAPAAYADVTLSGSINAGPAIVKSGDGSTNAINGISTLNGLASGGAIGTGATAQQGQSASAINTNYSNITIGSLEDLGGGLKLDFAYQLTANFQSSTNAATNRNSHIGLVGDSWGGIWYGTNEMLYESYYYTVDPLDGAAGLGGNLQVLGTPGYGRVFDNPGADPSACGTGAGSGCAGFYRRDSNAIWYNSPNFNGFSGGAYATLPMSATTSAAGGGRINPFLWGIGGKYVGPSMPIQAWVAYEQHHDMFGFGAITPAASWQGTGVGVADSSKDYGVQLGAGYTFGDIFAYINFEMLKYQDDVNPAAGGGTISYKRNAMSIGAKWNVSTGYVGGQFIKAWDGSCDFTATVSNAITGAGGTTNCGNSGAWMVGVGYYHTLSKQTQAYIMGSYTNNDDLQFYSTAGGAAVATNLGANVYGVTIGLKHSF
jgi:predicted porin